MHEDEVDEAYRVDEFTDSNNAELGTRGEARRWRDLNLDTVPKVLSDGGANDPAGFEDRYRTAFEDLGLVIEAAHRVPSEALPDLPSALRIYYELAGCHPINVAHNRLIPPEALRAADGRLVFMTENQNVTEWSITDFESENPMVLQRVSNQDGTTDWYPEDLFFSDFIVAMLRWTVTGEALLRDR
jgi:hypothetical protein